VDKCKPYLREAGVRQRPVLRPVNLVRTFALAFHVLVRGVWHAWSPTGAAISARTVQLLFSMGNHEGNREGVRRWLHRRGLGAPAWAWELW
jgi:hypothetical protein